MSSWLDCRGRKMQRHGRIHCGRRELSLQMIGSSKTALWPVMLYIILQTCTWHYCTYLYCMNFALLQIRIVLLACTAALTATGPHSACTPVTGLIFIQLYIYIQPEMAALYVWSCMCTCMYACKYLVCMQWLQCHPTIWSSTPHIRILFTACHWPATANIHDCCVCVCVICCLSHLPCWLWHWSVRFLVHEYLFSEMSLERKQSHNIEH